MTYPAILANENETLRILYQCDGFLPEVIGGTEVFSWNLLQALRARGHDLLVLTSGGLGAVPERNCQDGINIIRIGFGEILLSRDLSLMLSACANIDRIADAFRPEILVIADTARSGFFFLRQRSLRNVPRLLVLHSPIRVGGRDTLQMQLIAEADTVVAVSESLLSDAAFAAPQAAIVGITNALPLPAVPLRPLPFQPSALMCIGRLVPDKGIDVAIESFALSELAGSVELVVVGNGPERRDLQLLAQQRGVEDHVRFTNWALPDAVPALLNSATVVIVPSRWREPFGLVALQAAQMGRPVIASRVGGLPGIVRDGDTGLLVDPDDPFELAAAIADLLADPDRTRSMGMNARRHAEITFPFDQLVDSYEAAMLRTASAEPNSNSGLGIR